MRVRMNTTAAGSFFAKAGEEIEVDAKVARELIAGRYAVEVTADGAKANNSADSETAGHSGVADPNQPIVEHSRRIPGKAARRSDKQGGASDGKGVPDPNMEADA